MENVELAIKQAGGLEIYTHIIIAENEDIFREEAVESKAWLLRIGIGTDMYLRERCDRVKKIIKTKITKSISIEDIEFVFENMASMDVYNISQRLNKEPGFIKILINRLEKFTVNIQSE